MALPAVLPNPIPLPSARPTLRLSCTTTPATAAAAARSPDAYPLPDELQLVAEVRSPYNHIRVADVSPRAAWHPLAGTRLLLLDAPGNIHSLCFPRRAAGDGPLFAATGTYFDAFATLPPLLPRPSVAVLGFGAGSAARALLQLYPDNLAVHGWELDPAVLAVARDFFGLAEVRDATLRAMAVAFGKEMVSVMDVDGSWVALTGPPVTVPEEEAAWKEALPAELRRFVDAWRPY